MKVFRLSCHRFQKLSQACEERAISPREEQFLGRHRESCAPCRQSEEGVAMALNMLREIKLEPEVSPQFDQRVLRRLRVQNSREGFSYWSPALVGAAIAAVTLLGALQLIAHSPSTPEFSGSQRASAKAELNDLPLLLLKDQERSP